MGYELASVEVGLRQYYVICWSDDGIAAPVE